MTNALLTVGMLQSLIKENSTKITWWEETIIVRKEDIKYYKELLLTNLSLSQRGMYERSLWEQIDGLNNDRKQVTKYRNLQRIFKTQIKYAIKGLGYFKMKESYYV